MSYMWLYREEKKKRKFRMNHMGALQRNLRFFLAEQNRIKDTTCEPEVGLSLFRLDCL